MAIATGTAILGSALIGAGTQALLAKRRKDQAEEDQRDLMAQQALARTAKEQTMRERKRRVQARQGLRAPAPRKAGTVVQGLPPISGRIGGTRETIG